MARKPAKVASAAEVREILRSTPGTPAGRSILEIFWQELDQLMDQIMDDDLDWEDGDLEDAKARAGGVAWCISIVHNPYVGDLPAVRELAKTRWEQRQDGEEMDALITRP